MRAVAARKFILRLLALGALGAASLPLAAQAPPGRVIPLAGVWRFLLDPTDRGVRDRVWQVSLPDKIALPGSTDQARYGTPNTRPAEIGRLSRAYEYAGPAWYQRDIEIPYAWRRRRITLFLERCHWETRVWIDNVEIGTRDSLSVPHVYDLTAGATAGRHRLTIRVDNRMKVNIGPWAHAVSEETQTNWNGIIGRIELIGTARVWIDDLRLTPDPASSSVRVRATIGNMVGRAVAAKLKLSVGPRGGAPVIVRTAAGSCAPGKTALESIIPLGDNARRWSEFSTALYEARAELKATEGGTTWVHDRAEGFGLRSLVTAGRRLQMNGRNVVLRGTVESCVFPRTGYPPVDSASWDRIFATAKSYGLNHMRFHSWCPPAAAFDAADRAGFLLQVEAPQWVTDVGQDAKRDAYIQEEALRILDEYGNHPSFGLMCMGNELGGVPEHMEKLVRMARDHDPRHLYVSSTAWSLGGADDVCIAPVRGLKGPRTDHDFRTEDSAVRVPVISHEVGQWAVYPALSEIGKYNGVLLPRNLMAARESLTKSGLLPLAGAFTHASGMLSAALYKEEIEALLRTPGHAGFQLLGLSDYPGHGTATVGMLDAFWDAKGLVSAEEHRRYCAPVTPLARLSARAYTVDDTIEAGIDVANYGPADLVDLHVDWSLATASGMELARGSLTAARLAAGDVHSVGRLSVPLRGAPAPCRAVLRTAIRGGSARNEWSVWVYPPPEAVPIPGGVLVAQTLDAGVEAALAAGRSVLLLPRALDLRSGMRVAPTTVFWSPILFPSGPLTMGLLCDTAHPALAGFPTEAHADWQWSDLLMRSRCVDMTEMHKDLAPIVRVIDNFARNLPLACLFEARALGGKLLVCTLDIGRDTLSRPVAAQMLRSLLEYAGSARFAPVATLEMSQLRRMLRSPDEVGARLKAAPDLSRAALHVRAARALKDEGRSDPWSPDADEVVARQSGFDYMVAGSTWKDRGGAAWHDDTGLTINLRVPKGFVGALYVHFRDWNDLDRTAVVTFQGRFVERVEAYGGAGAWVRVPVTAEDSAEGSLTLVSRPERVNDMVTELALVPAVP